MFRYRFDLIGLCAVMTLLGARALAAEDSEGESNPDYQPLALPDLPPDSAPGGELFDLVFVIDGSGSIAQDFELQKEGIASCLVGERAFIPPDGSVAIAVVQAVAATTPAHRVSKVWWSPVDVAGNRRCSMTSRPTNRIAVQHRMTNGSSARESFRFASDNRTSGRTRLEHRGGAGLDAEAEGPGGEHTCVTSRGAADASPPLPPRAFADMLCLTFTGHLTCQIGTPMPGSRPTASLCGCIRTAHYPMRCKFRAAATSPVLRLMLRATPFSTRWTTRMLSGRPRTASPIGHLDLPFDLL